MKPIVFDSETNILNNTIGKMKASPFYPANDIVLGCFMDSMDIAPAKTYYYVVNHSYLTNKEVVQSVLRDYDMIVGHNIKFDLLYLRLNYNELYLDWLRRGGTVWDTQIVEYLLSGQTHLYPKLDNVSVKYGGELKDDKIKEYWDNGVDTADIPTYELLPYLQGDVNNTDIVFQAQQEGVMANNMIPLVTVQMDALLALVEMEWNGIEFDSEKAIEDGEVLKLGADIMETELMMLMEEALPVQVSAEITPGSSKQLSALLFGGSIKCEEYIPKTDPDGNHIRFKSGLKKGMVRTKKRVWDEEVVGCIPPSLSTKGTSGRYSTNDKTIKKVVNWYKTLLYLSPREMVIKKLVHSLLEWRKLTKDYSTYYVGLLALVFPDGRIHPNYNQCATATGRLSSNSPNGQNFSTKKEDD